jgi:hypothetical protein
VGQYHYVVNYDKKQFLHPHKFDDGLKLMEFGCSAQSTLLGLAVLLAASNTPIARGGGDLHPWHGGPGYEGRVRDTDPARGEWLMKNVVGSWAGDRVAIIGDYAEDEDAAGLVGREGSPWNNDGESWTDISVLAIEAMELDFYVYRDRHRDEKKKAG